MNIQPYRKFIVALAGAAAVAATVTADGAVSINDAIAIVIAALQAGGVYRVPNEAL